MRALPLTADGQFAGSISRCRTAALRLYEGLLQRDHSRPLFEPQLDIVVWAVPARTASESSRRAREIFAAAANHDLHLAVASFPRALCEASGAVEDWDQDRLSCLRACVMKPEHEDWIAEILERLDLTVNELAQP
jgi:hypothetical protein